MTRHIFTQLARRHQRLLHQLAVRHAQALRLAGDTALLRQFGLKAFSPARLGEVPPIELTLSVEDLAAAPASKPTIEYDEIASAPAGQRSASPGAATGQDFPVAPAFLSSADRARDEQMQIMSGQPIADSAPVNQSLIPSLGQHIDTAHAPVPSSEPSTASATMMHRAEQPASHAASATRPVTAEMQPARSTPLHVEERVAMRRSWPPPSASTVDPGIRAAEEMPATQDMLPAADQLSSKTPAHRQAQPDTAPSSPASLKGSDLFAPQAGNRSPQEWAARLAHAFARSDGARAPSALAHLDNQTTMPEPAAHTATQPAITAAPIPLAESTRQLLRPLVGVDTATVRIYHGPDAESLAAAHQADAITLGDAIIVGAGHRESSQEGLGLLAHELVHVARRRAPLFVPPMVRADPSPASGQLLPTNDEERLAEKVEALVVREAHEQQRAERTAYPPPMGNKAESAAKEGTPETRARGLSGDLEQWGSLPAPWEPLPDLSALAPARHSDQALPDVVAGATAQSPVQRAAQGRNLPHTTERPETPGAGRPPEESSVEPPQDLDLLARQVYAILRRRLQAEQRRSGQWRDGV